MKIFIGLLLFLFSFFAQAECNNKIDPSKVVLFIDTRFSDNEITTAEKAACARGEKLVFVPKNYKQFTKYIQEIERAEKELNSCEKKNGPANCESYSKKHKEVYANLDLFKKSQKPIKDSVAEALKEIKQQNGKIQSFLISGHDGGGHFDGYKGNLSSGELAELMKSNAGINEVKSILLLGGYTGVQKEIMIWKNVFPDVRLIAGYDASGPFSDKPLGHQYISEILTKEKELTSQADLKRLQDSVKANVKSLSQLYSAMYVNCDPKGEKEFYYGSKSGRKFGEFSLKSCLKKSDELKAVQSKVDQYESGALEPSTDAKNGELRQLYNVARANEHCFEILGIGINVDHVFNLLFYEDVKKSFAKFYANDLKESEKILATLNVNDLEKNFRAEMAKEEEALKVDERLFDILKSRGPKAYFDARLKELEKLKEEVEESFINKYSFLTNRTSSEGLSGDQKEIYDRFINMRQNSKDQQQAIEQEKTHSAETLLMYRETLLNSKKQQLIEQHILMNEIKNNPAKLKEVWSPTGANLEKKSRKELMMNLHNLNNLLTLPGVTKKQRQAMRWINDATNQHLKYFQNPFSWHETSPTTVEVPKNVIYISDVQGN